MFHLWLPVMALVALLWADAALGLDQRVADAIYAWEGQRWALRDAISTELLMHQMGRNASALAWGVALGFWTWSLHRPQASRWRKPLGYLLLATLVSAAMVAWIKSWSNMDCPWDLARYGGERSFVALFDARPVGMERARCMPAGHASAGYAWLALYYFLGVVRPAWRKAGLGTGLALGLLFGISQQMRGAHFLSHDLWTLAICWVTASFLYRVFWP